MWCVRCEREHDHPLRPFNPPHSCSIHPYPFLQANLVRESEKMVRDTATRLERAAGELEDLLVRAPMHFAFCLHDSPLM